MDVLAFVCAWNGHVVAKDSDLSLGVKVPWQRVGEAVGANHKGVWGNPGSEVRRIGAVR